MKTLKSRLTDKRAGKYLPPFRAAPFWGGVPFKVGENVGFRSLWGRWCEEPDEHLRFCGLSNEIIRMGHTGWLTQDDGWRDELARGVVYQLPAKDGECRFIAAIADPCNADKDGSGPCIVEITAGGMPEIYSSKEDAARYADNFAERYAESEREFDRIETERTRLEVTIGDNEAKLDELRSDARGLLTDIRDSVLSHGLCERLKKELRGMRREMHAAFADIREAREKLEMLPA